MSGLRELLEELVKSGWIEHEKVYEAYVMAEKAIFDFKIKNRLEMPKYKQYRPKGRLKDILKEALEFWRRAESEEDKMKRLRLMRRARDCLVRAYFITRPRPTAVGG